MRTLLVLLAACTSGPSDDVVGPYTGEVRRYVVDSFVLPANSTEARQLADDLDGDGAADNTLGLVIGTLSTQGIVTRHASDMIASGAIASFVEVQADDVGADDTVSVRYLGVEGGASTEAGGRFIDGVFRSNRTRASGARPRSPGWVPGTAMALLPVFVDADPSMILIEGMEIDLRPDGRGGYDGVVRGIVGEAVNPEAANGLMQMIRTNPNGHPYAIEMVDYDRNGQLSVAETLMNTLVQALLHPDVKVRSNDDVFEGLSVGFGVHLSPCPSGNCAMRSPTNTCFDRAHDDGESDIDCGGSSTCLRCPANAACTAPTDCQSGSCSGGVCGAPSCSNGMRDGFETDIDCGWNCGDCATGQTCWRDGDCVSGNCTSTYDVLGYCR